MTRTSYVFFKSSSRPCAARRATVIILRSLRLIIRSFSMGSRDLLQILANRWLIVNSRIPIRASSFSLPNSSLYILSPTGLACTTLLTYHSSHFGVLLTAQFVFACSWGFLQPPRKPLGESTVPLGECREIRISAPGKCILRPSSANIARHS